ncbi:holo-[acyl-carrier-protein] synthase [Helicobacter saguini]|uniref:Holo-[acyl-carrier-protein] synthase n=1 Tax=Helicobacter saguini TaxID=1548018 RepID=A0A347VS30_9HELI|nr:holo-ACP synthase [Helicobacter saguini]MWV62674.1 holo-[acyl-carrier-protein] synthase [Helicobacter saguini]MWV66654.1 holo-[acyl-carrier-protein] synthase [Helicobacter saguini]MWV69004.1 holo-[acyl-carrier-protein] synthase [Helicobacter saguini]MWV71442.1 holo-[acyl-carrier-protein] synthase [Helicobacter saguini]TLD94091.1 holo-[acyl-carrier-protein] synthase [Helicobacter saguini]
MKLEIGNDIVEISRIDSIFRRYKFVFLNRILHPCEILLTLKQSHLESSFIKCNKFFKDSKNPYFSFKKLQNIDSINLLESFESLESFRIETIAGFWAAKEATSKALGCGISKYLGFKDMCIFKDSKGKPYIKINKKKKKLFHIKSISISLSHEKNLALATCMMIITNKTS